MTISPLRSSAAAMRAHRQSSSSLQGFSLVECILSIAITATSLLAVVGMLVGTLGVARDTKEETVSGVLIRQLAGEIKDLPQPAAPGGKQQPLIVLVDESMKILDHSRFTGSSIKEMYDSGSPTLTASAFARIDRVPDPQDMLMDRIVIRVESPASAPSAIRTVRRYAASSPK